MSAGIISFSTSYESPEQRRQRLERERQERERREAELRARLERERQERERRELQDLKREAAAQRRLAQQAVQTGLALQQAQRERELARLREKFARASLSTAERQKLHAEMDALQSQAGGDLTSFYRKLREIESRLTPAQPTPTSKIEPEQWLQTLAKFEADLLANQELLARHAAQELGVLQQTLQNWLLNDSQDYAYNLASFRGVQQRLREAIRACEKQEAEQQKREAAATASLVNLHARLSMMLDNEPPVALRQQVESCRHAVELALSAALPLKEQTVLTRQPEVDELERKVTAWWVREQHRQQLILLVRQTLEAMDYEVVELAGQTGQFEVYIPGGEMVEVSVGPDGSVMSEVRHLVPEGPPTLPDQAQALLFAQQRDKWCHDYDRMLEHLARQGVQLVVEQRENRELSEIDPAQFRQSSRAQVQQMAVMQKQYLRS